MTIYMAIYVHTWQCMAIYGHTWPYIAMYGHKWLYMATYGHIWPYVAMVYTGDILVFAADNGNMVFAAGHSRPPFKGFGFIAFIIRYIIANGSDRPTVGAQTLYVDYK